MHRAKDGTTVQACLMHACDFALAGCRAIGPAFRGGGTAADPNDWSERQPAEQPSAGLEHSGRSPFQIAAREEMLLQSADQEGGIKIGTFDPVVGVGHPPLAERVHYHAQALASRREPVIVASTVGAARPAFNHTMVL